MALEYGKVIHMQDNNFMKLSFCLHNITSFSIDERVGLRHTRVLLGHEKQSDTAKRERGQIFGVGGGVFVGGTEKESDEEPEF